MSNYTSSPGTPPPPGIPLSINELPLLSTHAIIDKGVLDFFSATIVLRFLPRYAIKNMKLEKGSMTCRGAVLIVVAVIKYDPNSHIGTVFDQFSETFKKLRVSARKITLGTAAARNRPRSRDRFFALPFRVRTVETNPKERLLTRRYL